MTTDELIYTNLIAANRIPERNSDNKTNGCNNNNVRKIYLLCYSSDFTHKNLLRILHVTK